MGKRKINRWTDEEDDFIKANYGKMKAGEIAKALGRHTANAVRMRANNFRITRCNEWTDEEIAYLKGNFAKAAIKEMTGTLVLHPWGSILKKATALGLERTQKNANAWTDEELDFLKANYGKMKAGEIAKVINRSANAVVIRAKMLGLKSDLSPVKEKKPEAKPSAPQRRRKPEDYGPYDPTTHCCECKHYRPNPSTCGCWHVKGEDGGYKDVRPGSPACRYFVGKWN